MATGDVSGGVFDVLPVGHVVGANLRRLREERRLTQHEAARLCKAVGLGWTRVRIAAIERGDRDTVDLGTLVLLAEAFDVPIADLFAGPEGLLVSLSSAGAVQRLSGVRRYLAGARPRDSGPDDRPVVMRVMPPEEATEQISAMVNANYEADEALAVRVGVQTIEVMKAAYGIWGRSLTDERDARVGALGKMEPGERQAHRGHITRELGREVEERLAKDDTR